MSSRSISFSPSCLAAARGLGFSLATVRSRLRHWFEMQPPDHFLLIEPDEELRRILTVEMRGAVALPVKSGGLERRWRRR